MSKPLALFISVCFLCFFNANTQNYSLNQFQLHFFHILYMYFFPLVEKLLFFFSLLQSSGGFSAFFKHLLNCAPIDILYAPIKLNSALIEEILLGNYTIKMLNYQGLIITVANSTYMYFFLCLIFLHDTVETDVFVACLVWSLFRCDNGFNSWNRSDTVGESETCWRSWCIFLWWWRPTDDDDVGFRIIQSSDWSLLPGNNSWLVRHKPTITQSGD